MSNFIAKRIQSEIIGYEKDKKQLNKNGIFLDFNSENIFEAKALAIGKNGSYTNAPWLFNCSFPNLEGKGNAVYPIVPPKIKHATTGRKNIINNTATRFNPNLYEEGKVCLSIINTWDGPKWVPSLNLEKVIMTIQSSVMIENALNNEPPYNYSQEKLEQYDLFIRHQIVGIAIIQQTQKLADCFANFREVIKTHFLLIARETYEECYENAEKYKDVKEFKDPFYRAIARNSWEAYLDEIKTLTTSLLSEKTNEEWNELANSYFEKSIDFISLDYDISVNKPEPMTPDPIIQEPEPQVKKGSLDLSKRPPAKTEVVGTEWQCENSGTRYIVKERKNGIKYWLKVKNIKEV